MTTVVRKFSGFGSPEGAVSGPPSATYDQLDASSGFELWEKTTGFGNTGWRPRGLHGLYVEAYGAKGDGTTNDATAFTNALAAGETRGLPVWCRPGATYKLNSGIIYDVSKTALLSHGATVLDFVSVATSTVCVQLYSSIDFTNSLINERQALSGIKIRGNINAPVSATGLLVGRVGSSYVMSSNFSVQDGSCEGFTTDLSFTDNAWRIKFENFDIMGGGGISAPSSSNMGENISFRGCFIGNATEVNLIQGFFDFEHCSFDNIILRAQGDVTAQCTQCHFENPNNSSSGYRYVSIESDPALVVLNQCNIILDQPTGGGNWNQAIFYVQDTNTTNGLQIANCSAFQLSYYQPNVTDGIQSLVAGKGRVVVSNGGLSHPVNFNAWVVARSLNALYNGDGETTNTNGWTVTGTGTFSSATDQFKAGSRSLKMVTTAGQSLTALQKFSVSPGQWVYWQQWEMTTITGGATYDRQIYFLAADGSVVSSMGYQTTTGSQAWTLKSNGSAVVPVGAVTAQLTLDMFGATGSGNSAWIDETIVNVV